ncbi:MAG TPA: CotH kinase family protein, partial [Desulfuromonadaceae bacterium]|nr:CotH kinase family protein [Desulfuromonadaceae bacterium]
ALYKMYNSLNAVSSNEKKTRQWDDTSDLNSLVTNLNESIPLATRTAYAYDSLDLPQAAEYFATMALASSQDLGHKNYYLYHDNDGTGEWSIFPWDVDLTWGRTWVSSFTTSNYFNDVMFTTNVLNFYPGASIQNKATNRLFDLFFASPDFRQMYLRRLRTFMDNVLMPPGTATNLLVIEPLVRQYEARLNPPGISPSDATLDNAAWGPVWGDTSLSVFPNDAERMISSYLAGRRTFLFSSPSATLNGDPLPAAQPTNAALAIASWDFNPASGNPNEQYVEFANTNAFAVDVSGWKVVGGISHTFRPGTIVPAGKSIFISPKVTAFRARLASPHGGQSLYVQGPFNGFLSSAGNTPLILENAANVRVAANSYAGNLLTSQLTQGNLVVLRVGDGAETLGSHGNSVFLDQFTTNGTLVNTITIPNNDTNSLLISGSASSEGALNRSPDGRLLTFSGYRLPLTNAAALPTSLANTNAVIAPRALGAVDLTGAYTIVALTTNQYSQNNIRAGATDGRGNYWGAGGNSGTFYFGTGPTNTVQTNVANTIDIQVIGGTLFFSTQKITNGIWKISGSTAALVFKTGGSSAPYAFAFNPTLTMAYIADDTATGKGGVQRWDFNGSSWAMSYAFSGITNVGARGLTADFSGPNPILYATTAEATTNRLVSITDTGAASAVTTLATAGVNQVFRGVALAPDSASVIPQFLGIVNTNGFKLTWTALLYENYSAQYVGYPSDTNWTTFANITATLPVMTVYDTNAPAGTNRYYRVVLNP